MRIAEVLAVMLAVACSTASRPSSPGAPAPQAQGDPHMSLDQVLQRASRTEFATYDPGAVIAAVNALIPLGRDGALGALDAFVASQASPHDGLFLVLRVAFDAEPHPVMRLGGSHPAPPADRAALPRFPIMMVDDVPLMLVASYTLRGLPEPITAHLAYYREHGKLRAAPLAPAAGPDRMAGYDAQYRAAYGAAPSDAERALIQAELGRLGR
jgi:hypothetical protein